MSPSHHSIREMVSLACRKCLFSGNIPNILEIWDKKNKNTTELTELDRILGLTEHIKNKKEKKVKKKGAEAPWFLRVGVN